MAKCAKGSLRTKFKPELLDELLKDQDPQTVLSSAGLFGELKKALAERILNAELDHHLSRRKRSQATTAMGAVLRQSSRTVKNCTLTFRVTVKDILSLG